MTTSAEEVSLKELQTRLVTFTQQLESIYELLESDPENVEYAQIAKDLVEVIKLTKEMIEIKMVEEEEQKNSHSVQKSVYEPPVDRQQLLESLDSDFSPGTCCEAKSNDVWYPAYIESLTSSNTYKVHYFGFGNKDELEPCSLRPIQHDYELYDKNNIAVGFKCEAKYYVDGVYYKGSVVEKTQYGYKFLFEGYGNTEEVPLEYMREPSTPSHAPVVDSVASTTQTKSDATSTFQAAPIDTKLLKIPDHLQILPTDTEAEKERKRKRIKAIKSLNRHKSYEIERNQKQMGWKSFQSKAIKKKAKGTSGVLSKRGSSIFASPDTVDGKVGVVGSGQGMTAFQDARKKYKRDEQ